MSPRDGRAGVSSSRGDRLRASLGIIVAQNWYTYRQPRSGPNIGTIDPSIGARDRSGCEGELRFDSGAMEGHWFIY